MEKESIEVFINSLKNFYGQIGVAEISVGVPYLLDSNHPVASDFTGIIGISGKRRGCVYFTCPKAMLSYLLMSVGESEVTSEHLCDMVGEIANTIAGNARKEFGSEFMISVPVVVQGVPEKIHLPDNTRSVVIPTKWKSYQSAIVVALD